MPAIHFFHAKAAEAIKAPAIGKKVCGICNVTHDYDHTFLRKAQNGDETGVPNALEF
jgi:hypothetical protein